LNKIYNWCGGRKVFIFYLLLMLNFGLTCADNFNDAFANFCILLGASYLAANVTQKGVQKIKE